MRRLPGLLPKQPSCPLEKAAADALHVDRLLSSEAGQVLQAVLLKPVEESKGELGLDHYELRFWRGRYHHMTLVILAHHFLVRLQQRLGPREGGLSAASRALRRRVAPRLSRAGGLPRPRHGLGLADTGAAAPPEPGRGALVAPRRPPLAPTRRPGGLSSPEVSAQAQDGRLLLPSPPHPAPP